MTEQELLQEFQAFTPDESLFREFLGCGGAGVVADLERVGLLVMAPEAFLTGATRQVLDELEQRRYRLLDLAIVDSMSQEQLSYLYLPVCRPYVPSYVPYDFRWWLLERRFTVGPIAALLLAADDDSREPIAPRLRRDKGHHIPFRAEADTLRRRLPSINGVLNMVHTSDDGAFLLREACAFFDMARICRAVARLRDPGRRETLDARSVHETYFYGYQTLAEPSGSFFDTYARVAARAASRLGRLLDREGQANALAARLASPSEGTDWNARTRHLLGLRAELATWLEQVRCDRGRETDLPTGAQELLSVLEALSSITDGPRARWDRSVVTLRAAGISLSPWEELILLSSLYYVKKHFPLEEAFVSSKDAFSVCASAGSRE